MKTNASIENFKTKVYPSKFGWAVFLFLLVLFLSLFWVGYDSEKEHQWIFMLIGISTLGFFVLTSKLTNYRIEEHYLHIKCPPFYNKKIAINSITKVAVSRNLISSPAPSLDRIEIYFNTYDSIVISPKDKLQFMEDLKRINPSITLVKSH